MPASFRQSLYVGPQYWMGRLQAGRHDERLAVGAGEGQGICQPLDVAYRERAFAARSQAQQPMANADLSSNRTERVLATLKATS